MKRRQWGFLCETGGLCIVWIRGSRFAERCFEFESVKERFAESARFCDLL